VPAGISIYDLIMPWKASVVNEPPQGLVESKLAKVVNCSSKNPIQTVNLAAHAQDVQAIMINPPWSYASKKTFKKKGKTLDFEEFSRLHIPTSVMKDGLVFIWVEKEVIS